jgi:hypothetical protein
MNQQINNVGMYEKNLCLFKIVQEMSLKVKRDIFAILAMNEASPHILLPNIGMTMGDFCVYYVLANDSSAAKEKTKKK